jgi:peptidoglycan/LPS O-acetylase OafA/YrhL
MTRAPELDVARALAVSAVLVGHAFPALHPIAARGVDVFFVLSGYLCASQLAAGADPVPWLARRLRRVYPAALAGLVVAGGPALRWSLLDFGLPHRGPTPTGHYWSLSVEVSGYVALAALALAPRRWWRPALVAVVAACVAGRMVADPGTAYRMLRWDGMAVGALWALAGAPSVRWALPALGVALVLPYGVAPLPAALGAVGLLSALRGCEVGSVASWLCSRSYALYLAHWPLVLAFGAWGVVVALPVAEVLFRVVDRPLGLHR